MKYVVAFALTIGLLVFAVEYQNYVINQQGILIQQMMTNPACNGRQ